MPKYTKIVGLSDEVRLPKIASIRLGIKKVSAKGNEYPNEVDYFVLNPEETSRINGENTVTTNPYIEKAIQVYGDKPKELFPVRFLTTDQSVVFPQALKAYGHGGLKCIGDGQQAERLDLDMGVWKGMKCPCEWLTAGPYDKNKCNRVAILYFMLPEVTSDGLFTIVTSSRNAIIDINSYLGFMARFCRRNNTDVYSVPFRLFRKPYETSYIDPKDNKQKKSVHFPINIRSEISQMMPSNRMIENGGAKIMVQEGTAPDDVYPAQIVEESQVDTRVIEEEVTARTPSLYVISEKVSENLQIDTDRVEKFLRRKFGIEGDHPSPEVVETMRGYIGGFIQGSNQSELVALIDPEKNKDIIDAFKDLKYPKGKIVATMMKFDHDTEALMAFLNKEKSAKKEASKDTKVDIKEGEEVKKETPKKKKEPKKKDDEGTPLF